MLVGEPVKLVAIDVFVSRRMLEDQWRDERRDTESDISPLSSHFTGD